ncbi:Aspartyl/glutamyl-tRNA(Asn/Gln) amidotransferase subunit C [Waddlia chondrophila 2032/99]|uniref:Aspartyl/glutamyl-tRNA(Asn/Gln) amidotransferase subunit C n=2 Tax=Waddlia chondrophila TaxID=71667 RepID=D6YVE5_WADCW|nr:Asp-tRNA(Asn)/Glu-tRNA(Gln) amidotransferase subunit GatC [Waddlia chondrophila]ADI38106.1 glutamyl-tRNA(Gln) amidotransferase subunit C [Waddlia chondrophila WSU 86-1044]CCB91196.1 Aspartyl/glutamyl-tRNA(Asn/Gln) amidotransferase subunit C [Waddlia chondrophila 2032/99]
MAHLDKQMIEYLSDLSRIDLSEEEQQSLLEDLEKILAYIDLLNEVDTEGVEPCNHVLADMRNVMREDEVGETMPREAFLNNAPAQIGGMIRVPPVIKGK